MKRNEKRFPSFTVVAKCFLAVQALSVVGEFIFSMSGNLIHARKYSLCLTNPFSHACLFAPGSDT